MRIPSHRARLAALSATALVAAMLSPLSLPSPAQAAPGVPNTGLNNLWNSYGNQADCDEWSGGDSTDRLDLEVDLDGDGSLDDVNAWFFADTYLGAPAARHEEGGFFHSFINNSIVIQKGSSLHTITGGNTCQERNTSRSFWERYAVSPITTGNCIIGREAHCGYEPGGIRFWNADATLTSSSRHHDTVAAFYYRVGGPKNGQPFTILNSVIATMPVNELVHDANGYLEDASLQPIWCEGASEQVVWGANVSEVSFGPDSIWGWGVNSKKLYYAEIPEGTKLTNPSTWRYRTSTGWSSDCRLAHAQSRTVASAFEVFQSGGRWWLVQVEPILGSGRILAYPGTQPWSFSSSAVVLYNAPEAPHQSPDWTFIYDARVTSFGASKFTVSYNANTSGVSIGCRSLNNYDASIYRPRFIDVPYSALVPTAAVPVSDGDPATAAGTSPPSAAGSTYATRGIHDRRTEPVLRPEDTAPAGPAGAERLAPGTIVAEQAAGVLAAGAPQAAVAADNSWYNGWAYPNHHGCPMLENYSAQNLRGTIRPDGVVELDWDAVGRDVWYWIYERNVSEDSAYRRFELWADGSDATVMPITSASKNGDTFSYYVVPFASGSPDTNGDSRPDIEGGRSNTLSGPVRMQPPAAPTGVTVTGTDFGAVSLAWNGVTYPTNQVFYWIRYWSDLETAPVRVGPWGPDSRGATVAPLASGHWYTFVVTAENLGGESVYSVGVGALVP